MKHSFRLFFNIFYSPILLEGIENIDEDLTPIVAAMREKFLKYWEEVPLATIIANCLHPSYRMVYTVVMLKRYKTFLGLSCEGEEARLRKIMDDIFSIYNAQRNVVQPETSSSSMRFVLFFLNS